MKILTILGTRPEIIRLSRVIKMLDVHCQHVLVHTGQNYDERLSDIFFEQLEVRPPDEYLGVQESSFGAQTARILEGSEKLLRSHRPDRVLILGDTNSGLSAIVASRLGIPVFHLEAGNRCYDARVPEEINRRIIDQCSAVLMPYTERSRQNLLAEGFPSRRTFVVGNPIAEVIAAATDKIECSDILRTHDLQRGGYLVATMHRAENVDDEGRLRSLLEGFAQVVTQTGKALICSLHPRTRARIEEWRIELPVSVIFAPPLGFFDFLRLERDAFCVVTDSGTVQEEACILGVPNVTIRDVTERPETIECGSNLLAGAQSSSVVRAVELVTRQSNKWVPPPEYLRSNVAETVCNILLGVRLPDPAEPGFWNEVRSTPAQKAHSALGPV